MSYEPVTVDVARYISQRFNKDVVVILSWDKAHDLVHTTTYGYGPADKIAAASLGDIVTKAAGCDLTKAKSFEDFRLRTTAEWAAAREKLLAACKAAHKFIEPVGRLVRPRDEANPVIQLLASLDEAIAFAEGRDQ